MAEDYTYTVANDKVTITGYTGTNTVVEIPTTINGLPVITIGVHAFRWSAAAEVTIPEGVTTIASNAFQYSYELTDVTIPSSVTTINDKAFSVCRSLANITIHEGVTNIGEFVFNACDRLTDVTFPESVTTIGSYAFYGCDRLANVTFPSNVTYLGRQIFDNCDSLTNVIFPENITEIPIGTFASCDGLTEITIPENITSIGIGAFGDCDGLTNVIIPESVTNIGIQAFLYCSSLINVTIPASVTSIGNDAFYYSLKGIYFQGDAPEFEELVYNPSINPHNVAVYYRPGTTGWDTANLERPAVLWDPYILSNDKFGPQYGFKYDSGRFRYVDIGFAFDVSGATNYSVKVEARNCDSDEWEAVEVGSISNGLFSFMDTQSSNYPCRYYRLNMP